MCSKIYTSVAQSNLTVDFVLYMCELSCNPSVILGPHWFTWFQMSVISVS